MSTNDLCPSCQHVRDFKGESQSHAAVEQTAQIAAEFVKVFKELVEQKATITIRPADVVLLLNVQMGQLCFALGTWWEAMAPQHIRDDEVEGVKFQ